MAKVKAVNGAEVVYPYALLHEINRQKLLDMIFSLYCKIEKAELDHRDTRKLIARYNLCATVYNNRRQENVIVLKPWPQKD